MKRANHVAPRGFGSARLDETAMSADDGTSDVRFAITGEGVAGVRSPPERSHAILCDFRVYSRVDRFRTGRLSLDGQGRIFRCASRRLTSKFFSAMRLQAPHPRIRFQSTCREARRRVRKLLDNAFPVQPGQLENFRR